MNNIVVLQNRVQLTGYLVIQLKYNLGNNNTICAIAPTCLNRL